MAKKLALIKWHILFVEQFQCIFYTTAFCTELIWPNVVVLKCGKVPSKKRKNVGEMDPCSGLPGIKKVKKAKFGHKQFQKRPNL